jgi:hypothetical protein
MEGTVRVHIETMGWWWGFAKGVRYVRPVDEEIFRGGYPIEQS